MKDAFKIKKGLNIAPVDPVSVVNPEAGDLIIDSSDDNKLKVFDEASSDWASVGGEIDINAQDEKTDPVGDDIVLIEDSEDSFNKKKVKISSLPSGGGSSGNLMSDFEKLTPTVSNVVATVDTVTYLPIDDNNKSVKAVFSGSNGFIRYEVAAPADLEGVQGVVQLWIKTSVENLEVIATRNGVQYAGPLSVNSSNKWRQYEIPVVFSDANYGFEIKANGSAAGDVFIDEAFVKVDSSMFQRNVSGAQYVGGLTAQGANNCQWSVTSTTFANFPVDNDCNTFTSNGNIKAPSTKIPGFIIPAGSPIGTYTVNAKINAGVSSSASAACLYRLSSHSFDSKTDSLFTSTSSSNLQATFGTYYIKLTDSSTDTLFQVQSRAASGSCSLIHTNAFLNFGFDVYYYPDSTSTIVTQNTELTAQTANEFVAFIDPNGFVSGENFDWINGNCTNANPTVCTYKTDLGLTTPLNCQVTGTSSVVSGTFVLNSSTTTGFSVTRYSGGAGSNLSFFVNCTRSTDYRKHATIVGKFENINSSELVKVVANNNGGQAITSDVTNITWSTKIVDNYNAWNGSQFTAPKSSYYNVTAGLRATTNIGATATIHIFINGNNLFRSVYAKVASIIQDAQWDNIYLNKNDVLSVRINQAITLQPDSTYHHISITELPDTESIIKNLSTQKTKCQTKFLASDTTATGTVSSLTYNNLTIGKRYHVTMSPYVNYTNSSNEFRFSAINNSKVIAMVRLLNDSGTGSTTAFYKSGESNYFIAEAGTLTFNKEGNTSHIIYGGTAPNSTYITLCELPDTYVETDEW